MSHFLHVCTGDYDATTMYCDEIISNGHLFSYSSVQNFGLRNFWPADLFRWRSTLFVTTYECREYFEKKRTKATIYYHYDKCSDYSGFRCYYTAITIDIICSLYDNGFSIGSNQCILSRGVYFSNDEFLLLSLTFPFCN